MEHESNFNAFNGIILLIAVIIIIVALVWPCWNRPKEFFHENVNPNNPRFRDFGRQEDKLYYNPRIYEPELNLVTTGSNFVGLPNRINYPWAENPKGYGEADIVDDGDLGNLSLSYSLCSPSCCSPQWAPPFSLKPDPFVCGSNQDFVPSSYMCNNGMENSGCLCMTKEQALFLNTRGGNG